MAADILRVMISSTAHDLPDHRAVARDACLATGYYPDRFEERPVRDVDPVARSMAMVDDADIYLCVLGRRYGTVPKGETRSITEMEFDRAQRRDLETLVFVMAPTHPVLPDQVEASRLAQSRLQRFAKKASVHLRGEFASPEQLKSQLMGALSDLTLERVRRESQALVEMVLSHRADDAQHLQRMRDQADRLRSLQARLPPSP